MRSQYVVTDINQDIDTIESSCHCGSVKMKIRLSDGLRSARRCTCSYCRMRGAIAVSAALSDIEILQGEDVLTLYQFNTKQARHYFCSKCGIYTHHQRRSNPEQFGVNVACLAGISPFDFLEVPVTDGINHPSDRKSGNVNSSDNIMGNAGILKFIPS